MTLRLIFASAQAAMMLLLLSGNAAAQTPSTGSAPAYLIKPIRVVLPLAPGGSSDAMVRIIGPRIGDAMGQSLIIDNCPGGAVNIGTRWTTVDDAPAAGCGRHVPALATTCERPYP